ncbi:MAG: hypothetical protein R3F37_23485 [Candidatus Competibacteraceae bacterium]
MPLSQWAPNHRGCALTPRGDPLYVANHTEGTVSVIDPRTREVVNTVQLGGKPSAIAISDNGRRDRDQTVFVTEFFAELIPGGPGEGFDDGKQAIVHAFPWPTRARLLESRSHPWPIPALPPTAARFVNSLTPTRTAICFVRIPTRPRPTRRSSMTRKALSQPVEISHHPRRSSVFAEYRRWPGTTGQFNVNVQALVHVVDTAALQERADLHVNLNNQIKAETPPANPTESLDRLFGNDLVAIDCDQGGSFCLIVSRGGNYAMRVNIGADGSLISAHRITWCGFKPVISLRA